MTTKRQDRGVGRRSHDQSYSRAHAIIAPVIKQVWVRNVTGLSNVPMNGAAIIALNHQSYLDFLSFAAVSPRLVYFVAAERLFASPIWGPLMRTTNQIYVDRASNNLARTYRAILQRLAEGELVGLFPEGTRAPDKHVMLPALTGVAKIAARTHVPVIPVGIQGAHDAMSRHDRRPKLKKVIDIRVGSPIQVTKPLGGRFTESDYRHITDDIMLTIASLAHKRYPHAMTEADSDV